MPDSRTESCCSWRKGQFISSLFALAHLSIKILTLQALFLPEASDYLSHSPAETVSLAVPLSTSPFVLGLCASAKLHKISINVGIHEPGESKAKVKNTSIWIDASGEVVQRYQKLHLFDMDLKDGPSSRESDTFEEGKEILRPFKTEVGRVGLLICFDLRYPEVGISLKRQGAQIITYSSSFTVPTGRAHWETLLRARAIETQCYVIAAGQAGQHNETRVTWGHSLIVSPWGEVLVDLGQKFKGPDIGVAEIDLGFVERIRRGVPLKRRTDVYPEL